MLTCHARCYLMLTQASMITQEKKSILDDLGVGGFFTSQSTAMVMSGRSVHLATLFSWASLTKQLTSTSCTYFRF